MWGSRYSDTGSLLAIFGGVLILAQGVLYGPTFYGYGSSIAAFGIVLGLGILVLGAVARSGHRRRRKEIGIAILLLSLVSFFAVSGFLLGALFGVVGGVLILTSPGGAFLSPSSSRSSGFSMGTPCGRCGRAIPSWTYRCPYCGYPDR
jgi:peptidoglycan/LPS O-acetylase OafA/YrhL